MSADPDRAAALIAKFKSLPGVVAAGWTSGIVEMERIDPFCGRRLARWRQTEQGQARGGDCRRAGKNALGEIGGGGMERQHRQAEIDLQAAEPAIPALELTETVEITALVAPDKPGGSDRLMLWIGNPVISTADEAAGAKLNLVRRIQRRRGRRPEGRQRLGRGAGKGIQGPALGYGQVGLEIAGLSACNAISR